MLKLSVEVDGHVTVLAKFSDSAIAESASLYYIIAYADEHDLYMINCIEFAKQYLYKDGLGRRYYFRIE